jgi:hypothetical protein
VRKALSTPALFKERLELRGWDVSAWKDEDSNAAAVARSPTGDLDRWMRIDHIYCRTVQLFDEATADNYFLESPPDVAFDCDAQEPDPRSIDDIVTPQFPDQGPVPRKPLLGVKKPMVWLRKLSEVLPAFLTHHRAYPGALLCHVLLFRTKKLLAFRPFRWRKRLANYRSKTSQCSLDLCESLIFDVRCCHAKTHSTRYLSITSP